MQKEPLVYERMMTSGEVAGLLRVDPKTVVRWANAGKLRSVRTLGCRGPGHRRFFRSEVEALLVFSPAGACHCGHEEPEHFRDAAGGGCAGDAPVSCQCRVYIPAGGAK
jgi:excisionase family DNA binding protein